MSVAPGVIVPWKQQLAAVCCHFNPCHYQSRVRNYHRFRAGVASTGIRLLTVELAFGADDFELKDVPDVLRCRANDVLWHKERLLNVGIARLLDEGFTKVAWLDADILFHDAAWPQRLNAMLDRCALCQAFATAARQESYDQPLRIFPGAIQYFHQTKTLPTTLTGLAWGARADLLRAAYLYDVCLVGGGDYAICIGGCYNSGNPHTMVFPRLVYEVLAMTPPQQEYFLRWATRFGDIVRGKIGFIPGTVEAMYHGEHQKRRYASRYRLLSDFDPDQDIALNDDQCWRWASAKPHLHQGVRDYFFQRREDE